MSAPAYVRTILVTGSNTGIGYELVSLFASKGHNVWLAARNLQSGKDAQAKLKSEKNLSVKLVQLDITSPESIAAAYKTISAEEPRLDILVHNAGTGAMDKKQNAKTVSVDILRETMEPNFFGMVLTTTTFLPLLEKAAASPEGKGYTNILEVSTDMASTNTMAQPDGMKLHFVAYNTSKAAANSYVVALAYELRGHIRVNAATPGFTSTKLNNFGAGGKTPTKAAELLAPYALYGPEDGEKTGGFYHVDHGVYPW